MLQRFFRALITLILRTTSKINTINIENISPQGSCILASNHLGRLDALMVYLLVSRPDIILTVAEKYQKVGFFRWAAKSLNAIFIDRFNADVAALRTVLKRIKGGEMYVIAPEGTRSKTESLIEGQAGAAYIAAKTGAPVIPVALTGTEDRIVVSNLKKLRRSPVLVRVGEPFTISPLDRSNRDADLKAKTDEIMCQIAALLPASHHGVYADHPRLKELTAKNQ
ncbi:MAG: 1-acyl-sn-glycerol-3-phosphate acyltransferase [Anaerolineales bacterium]|nr:1-acyl-sn-glycerol-3-phosphate acyltransferase [Anaerolineales bacterium]